MIPQMPLYPNLSPVRCDNFDDVYNLGLVMKEAATADPHENVNNPDFLDNLVKSGTLRFLVYKDNPIVNICLTLRTEKDLKEWNLSISRVTLKGLLRVEDNLVNLIAGTFLGKGYQEVEPKAIWKTIRHFIKVEEF
jgi:hypothetical protein